MAEVIEWIDGRTVVVEFASAEADEAKTLDIVRNVLRTTSEVGGLGTRLTAALGALGERAEVKYSPEAPYAPGRPIEVTVSAFDLD